MSDKPIRVRQKHGKYATFYDVYVRGEKYGVDIPAFRLNKWLRYALAYVRATSGALEPLQRCE